MRTCAALVLVLLAAACGNAAGQPAVRLHGTIVYTRSGGIAGLWQQLRVSHGRALVTALRPRRRHSFRLSADELSLLAEAVRKADLAHVRIRKSPPIADALHYTLTYRSHRLAFDQGNVPRRLKPLIALLDRLTTRR